jgi:purine catabolism regulator
MGLPTVREVWRLALPVETELLGENGNLTRAVSWARRVSSDPFDLTTLEDGEMVLISASSIHSPNQQLTLPQVVETLISTDAAAMVYAGEVPQKVKTTAAAAHGLCLFSLPADTDLRSIEKDIIRFIVEREAQLDRRGRQIYRQLAQLSLEDRGLPTIARALRQIAGDSVVIQDNKMTIQALSLTDDFPLLPEALEQMLSGTASLLRRWLTDQHLDSKAPPGICLDLGDGWRRCVAAIVIEDELGGYLSIIGSADTLDDLDRLAAERGALVCAVELAKRRAVEAAEQRLKGDFFDMILTAGATEEPALTRRAREMGYELNRHHAVALISLAGETSRSWAQIAGELRTGLMNADIQIFFCPHEENLAVLCSANDTALLKSLERHIQAARKRMAEMSPDTRIAVGIGWPGARLAGLRRSFAQAQEALTLAQTLFGGDKVLLFGDLGLYHLLCRLRGCDELGEFYKQTLAPLAEYDANHNTQLVSTLEAFFAHHGNASQTAESLYLHRNSLLYRLDRIREISGLDLDDAEDRFSLQLALKLRPLLSPFPNP